MAVLTVTREQYRNIRFNMISGDCGLRAHRVHGDLIRHCDLHRDMQLGLVKLRAALVAGEQEAYFDAEAGLTPEMEGDRPYSEYDAEAQRDLEAF